MVSRYTNLLLVRPTQTDSWRHRRTGRKLSRDSLSAQRSHPSVPCSGSLSHHLVREHQQRNIKHVNINKLRIQTFDSTLSVQSNYLPTSSRAILDMLLLLINLKHLDTLNSGLAILCKVSNPFYLKSWVLGKGSILPIKGRTSDRNYIICLK